jgi:hypothetical protein
MKTPATSTVPTSASLRRLIQLYERAAKASGKANGLLQKASELEQELFGTTRGDTDRDELIDALEYAQGEGGDFTIEEVSRIWGLNAPSLPPVTPRRSEE